MIEEVYLSCPYCWQRISVLVDVSVSEQEYVEDCEVCCNPMNLTVTVTQEGEVQIDASPAS